MLESLVQIELEQAVAVSRPPGDDATFANPRPIMEEWVLPVVRTQIADIFVTTGSG